MKLTRYLAADACGDVFIYSKMPSRIMSSDEECCFWSCKGEEEAIYKDGLMTAFGRILGLDELDMLDELTWQDEPIEIEINI